MISQHSPTHYYYLHITVITITTTRAKVIWQKLKLLVCKRNLVGSFYHIRQMAARVTKFVLWGDFGSTLEEREVIGVSNGERVMVVSYAFHCDHCATCL